MASAWVLTVGLNTVRAEFNSVFADRDHTTDGSVGDLAHQLESASGHNPDITGRAEYKDGDSLNEVRAIDVDKDLNDKSAHKVTMEDVIQYLVEKGRSGAYLPFRYFIYNRRIWSKSTGWSTRAYNGSNPHDKHAHFSGDYTQTADNWKGSLGLATLVKVIQLRTHSKVDLDGLALSIIQEGDNDRDFTGFYAVTRLQKLLSITADGDYGPKTTAAVKAYMVKNNPTKYKGHTGKKVALEEWRVIAGIFAG